MCGIVGFIDAANQLEPDEAHSIILQMANELAHRGPDDFGYWFDSSTGVGLGFRRLSIVDLSEAGHQPMSSVDGRYVLVFNGEIYNHRDIAKELEIVSPMIASHIQGRSDTSVILAAIEYWGVRGAVSRMVGMFSIALIDKEENCLHLVRDRMGEKPLYYGWLNGNFVFGSEIKGIKRHPSFDADIDFEAVQLFLERTFIPAPKTIYKRLKKLPPGTFLSISLSDPMRITLPQPYWTVRDSVRLGVSNQVQGTDTDLVSELEGMMNRSVKQQMVADVPVGAFLSGGIDSSLIAALMQSVSDQKINTFSVGFSHPEYDEAPYARAVAAHIGSNHTELYINDRDVLEILPLLPRMFDEPFADSSQIPTFLVSKLARSQVAVCLTGDGADELFGGYSSYSRIPELCGRISKLPLPLRKVSGRVLGTLPASLSKRAIATIGMLLGSELAGRVSLTHIDRISRLLLESPDPFSIYLESITQLTVPMKDPMQWHSLPKQLHHPDDLGELLSPLGRMLYFDQVGSLTDDMMTKVDRAAMSVSLETRSPFLDHRIVEWSWRLPDNVKIRNGIGKWILRELLGNYVPKSLTERRKQGFAVPVGDWLRGPLRSWAEELIDPADIVSQGILDPVEVRKEWETVLNQSHNSAPVMWSILMLQAWLADNGY